jgi:predicted nuclease of predicted toxin-antitoxin system
LSPPLLLDENFPAPAVRVLRQAGLDVLSIAESNSGTSDAGVLAIAIADGRWLVTFDLDFGALLFAQKQARPPAVLLLRVSRYLPEEPAAWVIDWLAKQPPPLGMFTVFDGSSFRNRPLA